MDLCIIMVGRYSIMDWDDIEHNMDRENIDEAFYEELGKGGYTAFMEEIKDVRDLTYKIVYEKWAEPKKMTKQQFYDMLIEMGLKDYSKKVIVCKTVQDMKDDMIEHFPAITENECVTILCDRGLMVLTIKEYNAHSSTDVIDRFKDEYEDEIRRLSF